MMSARVDVCIEMSSASVCQQCNGSVICIRKQCVNVCILCARASNWFV